MDQNNISRLNCEIQAPNQSWSGHVLFPFFGPQATRPNSGWQNLNYSWFKHVNCFCSFILPFFIHFTYSLPTRIYIIRIHISIMFLPEKQPESNGENLFLHVHMHQVKFLCVKFNEVVLRKGEKRKLMKIILWASLILFILFHGRIVSLQEKKLTTVYRIVI